MTELWTLSARELAGGIARKDFSCIEVVEAHLRRIEAVNPGLNAIVKTFGEEARSADRKVCRGSGARAAARRSLHDQGEHRRRRLPDDLGCSGFRRRDPAC
jgi:Asp-tRNA(Asn)/Glu-tRNA(Gln) amidotransferase A subunit family amidase